MKISHTNIYHQNYYSMVENGIEKELFKDEWQKIKQSDNVNQSEEPFEFYLSSIEFEEGISFYNHSSSLSISSTTTPYSGSEAVIAF